MANWSFVRGGLPNYPECDSDNYYRQKVRVSLIKTVEFHKLSAIQECYNWQLFANHSELKDFSTGCIGGWCKYCKFIQSWQQCQHCQFCVFVKNSNVFRYDDESFYF